MAQPTSVKPVVVVETPYLTITECFGRVATKTEACSLATVVVKDKSEARFQTPLFEEYVIVTEGNVDLVHGAKGAEQCLRVQAGEGVFLPKGLRVKWTWPEGGAKYTALCLPAFSPESTRTEADGLEPPADLDPTLLPQTFPAVNVVEAPNITITERFGHVASQRGCCSLATAVVKAAAEEAYQAPGFDEYVLCTDGSIEFIFSEGKTTIGAGEAIFLPKELRVKWIWPEPTKYTVVCLPAFSPELSGREEEETATVAKDSASMKKLAELHSAAGDAKVRKLEDPDAMLN